MVMVDIFKVTCGISPRRPRSLLPHSPSPPRALSPASHDISADQSPKHISPSSHVSGSVPIGFFSNKSLQSGRRWSVASSGYSTNTPCSSGLSSQTSSQEKLNQILSDDPPFFRQCSQDSTYSDLDDEVLCRARSPKPFRGRSRSLSPTRNESEVYILNNLYKERFPKAKKQMEEKLQEFILNYSAEDVESKSSDAAISFVTYQIAEIARTVLKVSLSSNGQINSEFFYHISDSIEKLLFEVRTKTKSREIEDINKMASKLLMILSRSARLLECLEFDPAEFYTVLEFEEQELMGSKVHEMGSYIRSKLGIQTPTPVDEKKGEVEEDDSEGGDKPRKQSILIEPKEEDFTYVKLISSGAYGSVYLVRHNSSRQRYAMKKMSKHHLMHKNQVQQVFTERDIMTFAQNPFVVTLFCTFETKKFLCMVMEFVEGGDCASLLKNIQVMPFDLARRYFAETVLAVEYIHDYGIIHRDLKPDNLLITAMGHIKLADFGLSKVGLMNMTTNICEETVQKFNDVQVFGTPDYIAPEVILRKGYGHVVDYWSLGIILYEFLIGVTPFYGENVQEVFDMILTADIEWPDGDDALPPEAIDIIKLLLIRDPHERLGAMGAEQVRQHPFFLNVNWNSLLREKAEFIPVLDNEEDTSYFDTREDRYNHLVSDEEYEEDNDIDFGNFSTCSPRFTRLISIADCNKNYQKDLKDLEEQASKEVSSAEDLPDDASDGTDDTSTGGTENDASLDSNLTREGGDGTSSETMLDDHPGDLTKVDDKLNLLTKIDDNPTTMDSGNDSGTHTGGSSLDNSLNGGSVSSLLRQVHVDVRKKCEDSDRDTDASTNSNDVSPRRFHSASFTHRRLPSPKQPSPLIIDSSHSNNSRQVFPSSTKKRLSIGGSSKISTDVPEKQTVSEPTTPFLLKPDVNFTADAVFKQGSLSLNRAQRTKSTPPNIDLSKISKLSSGAVPKLELSASDDETTLMKRPSRRRHHHHHHQHQHHHRSSSLSSKRRQSSEGNTPPLSPSEPPSEGTPRFSPSSLRPPIVIKRSSRGWGFTFKAIRVYIGDSSKYTMHHMVETVDVGGPAMEVGLKENDLITHVNDESVQGLQHVDVVRLILRAGKTVKLTVTDLSSTSIRTGSKRKSIGSRVQSRKLRGRSRNNSNEDSRSSSITGRRSAIYRKLRKPSLRRSSSLKRATIKSQLYVSASNYTTDNRRSTMDDSGNNATSPTNSSPNSPNSHVAKNAFIHGVLPKLARSVGHSRRRSISCIPVSPLARTPSIGASTIRSPSPLAKKSGVGTAAMLMSPTNNFQNPKPRSSTTCPGSPLLRRALSPDRLNPPVRIEDLVNSHDGTLLVPAYDRGEQENRRLIRSQSMKENKRKKRIQR